MSPPIPPAVVDAMARIEALARSVEEGWWPSDATRDVYREKVGTDKMPANGRQIESNALLAADLRTLLAPLATGSVVICTPELRKLMASVRAWENEEAEAVEVLEAASALARAHQEDQG